MTLVERQLDRVGKKFLNAWATCRYLIFQANDLKNTRNNIGDVIDHFEQIKSQLVEARRVVDSDQTLAKAKTEFTFLTPTLSIELEFFKGSVDQISQFIVDERARVSELRELLFIPLRYYEEKLIFLSQQLDLLVELNTLKPEFPGIPPTQYQIENFSSKIVEKFGDLPS
jgi:hypothetical protein